MAVLGQMEGGVPAAEPCREHGMSSATLYKWRAVMAEENCRLKRMFADISMRNDLLKEALGKK